MPAADPPPNFAKLQAEALFELAVKFRIIECNDARSLGRALRPYDRRDDCPSAAGWQTGRTARNVLPRSRDDRAHGRRSSRWRTDCTIQPCDAMPAVRAPRERAPSAATRRRAFHTCRLKRHRQRNLVRIAAERFDRGRNERYAFRLRLVVQRGEKRPFSIMCAKGSPGAHRR